MFGNLLLPTMPLPANLTNNDSKINELVREIELQKLEEYLIASEQMLSFERNDFEQNDLEKLNNFQYSLFENQRNSLIIPSLLGGTSSAVTPPSLLSSLITTRNNNEMTNFTEFNNFL